MLLYQPPFLEAGRLTIFRDDVDSRTFYYATTLPSIAMNGDGKAAISAYAILPESGLSEDVEQVVESNLSLEVSLGISEEEKALAIDAIKKEWGIEARRLAPVPISDGKVYLMVAPAGTDPDPEEWYITSSVSPSIIGDNRAALVIHSKEGDAQHMVAAMNSDVVSGIVYYELNMLGVAPVFRARMRVSWQRIYEHFEQQKSLDLIFYKKEISDAIDRLRESSAIEMEIEELDPDVKDFAAKTLLNELKSKVLEKLFKPAVPPLSASQKWEDRLASGISKVLSALTPGSHFIRKNISEEQLNETVIDLKERRVKKYPFYPQALLSSMIKRAGGLQDYLEWIELDRLPYRSQTVYTTLAADTFSIANVKSIKLECEVKDITADEVVKTMSFVVEETGQLKNQFNFIQKKDHEYEYSYQAKIFLSSDVRTIPQSLEIPKKVVNDPFIYLNVAEYFENHEIFIDSDDISVFRHAHLIEVNLRVNSKSEAKSITEKTYIFDAQNTEREIFSLLAPKELGLQFDLHVIYYLADSKEHSFTLKDMKDKHFFLPNPFENKWSVDIISAVDWQNTFKVLVEMRVFDPLRKEYIKDKFTITRNRPQAIFFVVSSLETPREHFEAKFTVINLDSSVTRGSWTQYVGPVLVVRDNIEGERTIKATLIEGPDFEKKDIKKVQIAFRYKDSANRINEKSDKLELERIGDSVSFRHPMPDHTAIQYEYYVLARSIFGDRYKTRWIESIDEDLNIILPEDIW